MECKRRGWDKYKRTRLEASRMEMTADHSTSHLAEKELETRMTLPRAIVTKVMHKGLRG